MMRGNIIRRMRDIPIFKSAETPVANEIALPAESANIQSTRQLGAVSDIQDLIAAYNSLPVIVRGDASGRIAGQWYRVAFPRRVENPHVVCTAKARAGDFITSEIGRIPKPPTKEIARASRPDLIDIPKESREEIPPISLTKPNESDIATECYNRLRSGCRDATPGWNWWPVSEIRNAMCDLMAAIGTVLGVFIYWFWKNWIKPDVNSLKKGTSDAINLVYKKLWNQTDKATTAMQTNINRLYTTETTDQINKVRDSIAVAMTDLHNSTDSQVDAIRDRVNTVLKDLYRMWGVPTGYILTPVHIRNITETGFEFQSYGDTEIQFICVGTGEAE